MGVDQGAWDKPGDGVEFRVNVAVDGKTPEEVFRRYLNPKAEEADRQWVDASIDLGRFGNQTVSVTLSTLPGSSPDFDWAWWADPRILRH